MTDIEQIKAIDIVELATTHGAKPVGRGNCLGTKHNPLRGEKSSSLKLYKDTNSWNDFGGVGGSTIDFYMELFTLDKAKAIEKLKRD